VIGDTVLGKIVGANFFFAATRSDLAPAMRGIFLRFFSVVWFRGDASAER